MSDKKYPDNSSFPEEFGELFSDVTPIEQDKAPPFKKKLTPKLRKQPLEKQIVESCRFSDEYDPFATDEEAFDLNYKQTSVPKNIFNKLKRQQFPIAKTIDLHGYTKEQAKLRVSKEIDKALSVGDQVLKIIHGHGKGVIKRSLNAWLRQDSDVLAFASVGSKGPDSPAILMLLKYKLDREFLE